MLICIDHTPRVGPIPHLSKGEVGAAFFGAPSRVRSRGLAGNVAFVSALIKAGVEFEAVDFPQANRLTNHILAAAAEHEAKVISERTKPALARLTN
jgi:hypothetical protein